MRAERGAQRLRQAARLRRAGREVERQTVAVAADAEAAAECLERQVVGGCAALAPEDVGGGERGVAAQLHFAGGGEPAEVPGGCGGVVVIVARWHEEGGFGEVVLAGDRLEQLVVGPAGEQTDAGGIAAGDGGGEGAYLVVGDHGLPPGLPVLRWHSIGGALDSPWRPAAPAVKMTHPA